jgi:hypothetical protein
MCREDPFLNDVMEEVEEEEKRSSEESSGFVLREASNLFGIRETISRFGDSDIPEKQWQQNVWNCALERRSELPDGAAVDWEK